MITFLIIIFAVHFYCIGFILAYGIALYNKPRYVSQKFAAVLSWIFVGMAIVAWWKSDKRKRKRIYKRMLRVAKQDLKDCKKVSYDTRRSELPELIKYRPDRLIGFGHWFDVTIESSDATKRIDILKQIINNL